MPVDKYNYTDRRTITRDRVQITLHNSGGGIPVFDCVLRIDDLAFPEDARVFIEAYRRSSYMRFNFGTVGAITTPSNRRLTDIDRGDKILFRLKIINPSSGDIGKLIGHADAIPAFMPGSNRDTILPVQGENLGQVLWRVDFQDEGPVLLLNSQVTEPNIIELAQTDGEFQSLVYPAAFEQILWKIIVDTEDVEDPDRWPSAWARLASRLSGEGLLDPTDYEGDYSLATEKIKLYVEKFADEFRFRERFSGGRENGS